MDERSEAQRAASRLNGAKGRGPLSEEGKAASRGNALKHGLRAKLPPMLAGEDADAFAELHAALVEEHAPEGALAHDRVRRLAVLLWRQERAEALEVEVLETRERRPNVGYAGGYHPGSPAVWDAGRLDTVIRYRRQITREVERTLTVLREGPGGGRKMRPNEPETGPEAEAMKDNILRDVVAPAAPGPAPAAFFVAAAAYILAMLQICYSSFACCRRIALNVLQSAVNMSICTYLYGRRVTHKIAELPPGMLSRGEKSYPQNGEVILRDLVAPFGMLSRKVREVVAPL